MNTVYTESSDYSITVFWGSGDEDKGEVIAFPKDLLYAAEMQDEIGIVMIDHMSQWGFDPDSLPFREIKEAVGKSLHGQDNVRPDSMWQGIDSVVSVSLLSIPTSWYTSVCV